MSVSQAKDFVDGGMFELVIGRTFPCVSLELIENWRGPNDHYRLGAGILRECWLRDRIKSLRRAEWRSRFALWLITLLLGIVQVPLFINLQRNNQEPTIWHYLLTTAFVFAALFMPFLVQSKSRKLKTLQNTFIGDDELENELIEDVLELPKYFDDLTAPMDTLKGQAKKNLVDLAKVIVGDQRRGKPADYVHEQRQNYFRPRFDLFKRCDFAQKGWDEFFQQAEKELDADKKNEEACARSDDAIGSVFPPEVSGMSMDEFKTACE